MGNVMLAPQSYYSIYIPQTLDANAACNQQAVVSGKKGGKSGIAGKTRKARKADIYNAI
jgi:hypothetical protein